MKYTKLNPIRLKDNKTVNEIWVHDRITDDPSLLGLGEVIVKDRERIHAGAGRLDMLLQDAEGYGRYEVEIQLGATDPSHIIRTLEYWDIERKRYPQYDHTAVIIAEDITSRFLNVISLFNGAIPVMAIQMKAVEIDGGVGLFFTRVLDTVQYGYEGEDEKVNLVDRAYWDARASVETVALVDKILVMCQELDPSIELNYYKGYIGLRLKGHVFNFATFIPTKKAMTLAIHLPQSEEIDREFEKHELEIMDYSQRWNNYRIRLSISDISKHDAFLRDLLKRSFDYCIVEWRYE